MASARHQVVVFGERAGLKPVAGASAPLSTPFPASCVFSTPSLRPVTLMSSAPRLYILTTTDVPNNVILGHASFAKAAGFDPVFVLPDRGNGNRYADSYSNYVVIWTGSNFRNTTTIRYVLSILGYAFAVSRLLLFRREIYSVLAVDFEGTIAALTLMARGALVFTLVNDNFSARYEMSRTAHLLLRFVEGLLYKLVSSVCILPDRSRVDLLGPVRPARIVILPNVLRGVAVGAYTGGEVTELTILVCGWLVKSRGLDLLYSILQQTKEKVRFVLLGTGDTKLVASLAQSERIRYLGHRSREDTLALMANVDLNLAYYDPSILINRYAMPQKVYDSMSVGCPLLINAEVQMAKTLVEHGVALSTPYRNVTALSALLNRLVDDRAVLFDISRRCVAYNELHFSYDAVERSGVEFYRQLLRPSGRV